MPERNRTFGMTLVLAAILFIGSPIARAATETETTPIGVASIDITPETPVRMYGYASRKTESEGVAGRLHAKALAIGGDAGDGPAVLLTVDCGAVPPDLRERVFERVTKKTDIDAQRFVLSNSHNHSGPNLKGMASITGDEHQRLAAYAQFLEDRLVRVVEEALDARQAGRLARTQGTVSFAANRRVLKDGKWSGFGAVLDAPADHSLPLLKVTREDGTLLAVVANYACHCTTLRGNFKQIHGDWAACAQEYIESEHPGVTAMITIGCGADSDPHPHSTVALCEQHGRALADEVKRQLDGPWQAVDPYLVARETFVQVPFAPAPDTDKIGEAAKRSHSLAWLQKKLDAGEVVPEARSYRIVTWTLGSDLAMVFLSDEVTVDYALRLKRELDADRLWITAYSHDISTYIVSPRLISEGGYEARNSLSSLVTYGQPETLQPSMEERIVEAVKGILPDDFAASGTAVD